MQNTKLQCNYKMSSQYFPPYGSTNNIKVELDLANYATKDDVKNIAHVKNIIVTRLKLI